MNWLCEECRYLHHPGNEDAGQRSCVECLDPLPTGLTHCLPCALVHDCCQMCAHQLPSGLDEWAKCNIHMARIRCDLAVIDAQDAYADATAGIDMTVVAKYETGVALLDTNKRNLLRRPRMLADEAEADLKAANRNWWTHGLALREQRAFDQAIAVLNDLNRECEAVYWAERERLVKELKPHENDIRRAVEARIAMNQRTKIAHALFEAWAVYELELVKSLRLFSQERKAIAKRHDSKIAECEEVLQVQLASVLTHRERINQARSQLALARAQKKCELAAAEVDARARPMNEYRKQCHEIKEKYRPSGAFLLL